MLHALSILISFLCVFLHITSASASPNTLTQYSLMQALLQGVYDGNMSYKEVRTYGNFGLGTFNHIDGEMVAVDGKFFQVKASGTVHEAKDEALAPFVMVTFFTPHIFLTPSPSLNLVALHDFLNKTATANPQKIYAMRVDGTFKTIRTRAVHAQKKPYPLMDKVVAGQAVFDLKDVKGTLVGFKMPAYLKGLNIEGYHWHFITHDHKHGGHVLDLVAGDIKVAVQEITRFNLIVPEDLSLAAPEKTTATESSSKTLSPTHY